MMEHNDFLEFLHVIEKMKCNCRHSMTSTGRPESVAEHSFRLVVMAYLLKDEIKEADMGRVLEMCLVHDFGEAITGDIPSFNKTAKDDINELSEVDRFLDTLPEKQSAHIKELFREMSRMETMEAKAFKALDKMEAVIQHNEADLSTWIPLEYSLQQTYGIEEAGNFKYLKTLREKVLEVTKEKIKKA
jgi:putative hydrolase of HD superfamily